MPLRNSLNSLRMRAAFRLLRLRGSGSAEAERAPTLVVRFPRNESPSVGLRLVHTRAIAGSVNKDEAPSPSPPSPLRPPTPGGFPRWARWILGSVLSLVLSFWMPKMATLIKIGGEAEIVMHEVEKAAEAVEKVATMAEKVSADVAQQLPDDAKIKAAALIAEHVSEEAANDARIVEHIIHKVDEVKQDMQDIGKMAEPVIDKIIHEKQKANNKL